MIRTYWLLFLALALVAAGAGWFSPGAALIVLGLGFGFVWWDSTEADQ